MAADNVIMVGKNMDNFKTVVAVLVVLVAFTGFQLIANHSLRKSVRSDVEKQIRQIESSDAELLRLRQGLADAAVEVAKLKDVAKDVASLQEAVKGLDGLKALPGEVDRLSKAIDALKAKVDAAAAKVGLLEDPVGSLEKRIGSLDAKVPAAADIERLAGVRKEIGAVVVAAESLRGVLDSASKAASGVTFDEPVARIQKALAELDTKITEMKNRLTEGPGT